MAALAGGGKRLYLNFWASYCGPCVAELPLLQELHAGGDVVVLALSMDASGDVEAACETLDARGTSFPAYFLSAQPEDPEGAPSSAVRIQELVDLERLPIPTTLVLARTARSRRSCVDRSRILAAADRCIFLRVPGTLEGAESVAGTDGRAARAPGWSSRLGQRASATIPERSRPPLSRYRQEQVC